MTTPDREMAAWEPEPIEAWWQRMIAWLSEDVE
jgi:hypothetical protein